MIFLSGFGSNEANLDSVHIHNFGQKVHNYNREMVLIKSLQDYHPIDSRLLFQPPKSPASTTILTIHTMLLSYKSI